MQRGERIFILPDDVIIQLRAVSNATIATVQVQCHTKFVCGFNLKDDAEMAWNRARNYNWSYIFFANFFQAKKKNAQHGRIISHPFSETNGGDKKMSAHKKKLSNRFLILKKKNKSPARRREKRKRGIQKKGKLLHLVLCKRASVSFIL